MTPAGPDMIIVGAGIIGAAVAFRAAEAGMKVVVLEQQAGPALGSTGRSAAGVRVQFSTELNVQLSWRSIEEYRDFASLYGEDSGYDPLGYLFLVPPERWDAHVQALQMQQRLDVPVTELPLTEAASIVPFDPSGVAGATFGSADGVVDPHSITLAYLRLARAHGARVRFNAPLVSAHYSASAWHVVTPDATVSAPLLVNAAGAWAGTVARRAGLEVPVEPVRRVIFATAPLPWQHRYPLTVDVATGMYLRSEGERVLFGRSNPDEPHGFNEGVDWQWLEPVLEVGLARFPWLERTALDRRASWWGYYEVTPDDMPILGRMPGVNGWINAAGFSGHGVQQAAMVGKLMAEEATEGRARSLDLTALRFERFLDEHNRLDLRVKHREDHIV